MLLIAFGINNWTILQFQPFAWIINNIISAIDVIQIKHNICMEYLIIQRADVHKSSQPASQFVEQLKHPNRIIERDSLTDKAIEKLTSRLCLLQMSYCKNPGILQPVVMS